MKIAGKDYTLSTFWHNTTLRQAIAVCAVDVKDTILDDIFTADDDIVFTPQHYLYMREVVAIMSGCPIHILNNVDDISIEVVFDMCKRVVYSLYYLDFDSYKPRGVQTIVFNKKQYSLPSSLTLAEDTIIAHKEPSINIVETANLVGVLTEMKKDGIYSMKYMCAILLKENEDEIYDEEVIANRAEEFLDLDMTIVMEVFFFINYYLLNYLKSSLLYLPEEMIVKVKPQRTSTLRGFTKWLSRVWQVIYMKCKNLVYGS